MCDQGPGNQWFKHSALQLAGFTLLKGFDKLASNQVDCGNFIEDYREQTRTMKREIKELLQDHEDEIQEMKNDINIREAQMELYCITDMDNTMNGNSFGEISPNNSVILKSQKEDREVRRKERKKKSVNSDELTAKV